MKILVTGARGFLGRNLAAQAGRLPGIELLPFDLDTPESALPALLARADAVVHLAGVNRPKDPAEFVSGNLGLTDALAGLLEGSGRPLPVVFASSIQAMLDNDYGKSKFAAEERLKLYAERTGAGVRVFRFANIFGKWCRPNYNSVVATFCHNVAHGLPLQVNNPDSPVPLIHVDDVVAAILREVAAAPAGFDIVEAGPVYPTTVGRLAELIQSFEFSRQTGLLPEVADPLVKRLYSTYLSYLDLPRLSVPAQMKSDERGWLFELVKTPSAGQIFVSTTKPGKKRGNHFHDVKVEKFCVIAGSARISLRRVDSDERQDIDVDGADIKIVDIPPGYTHSITNTGAVDCITLFWAIEVFDQAAPDTYFLEV